MSQPPLSPSYAPVTPFAPQPARSRLPLWSLGIGIAALVFSPIPVLGLLVGLVAIVLSAIALARITSKIKSAIGLGLGVVALIVNVIVIAALGSADPSHVNAAAILPATTVTAAGPTTKPPTVDATPPTANPTTELPTVAPTTAAAPPVVKHTTTASTTEPISAEKQNAIRSAQSYLEFSAFSRKGLIKQLSSDAGDGYSVEAATYAVDSLHIDFNEQAYKSAMSYLKMSGFSRAGLIEQLESDAGEGFTHSQAVYGVNKAGL
jgi:hypothetical protein